MPNDPVDPTLTWGTYTLLALTAMGEAGGDALDGSSVEERIAVMCVIRNRVADRRWPDWWTQVILQPQQFSCWNPGRNRDRLEQIGQWAQKPVPLDWQPDRVTRDVFHETCYLAQGIPEDGPIRDCTGGACHYLTVALYESPQSPRWAREHRDANKLRIKIGSHYFLVGVP